SPSRGILLLRRGIGYRSSERTMVAIEIRNRPDQEPWVPGSARLLGASGALVKVRSVRLDWTRLTSGVTDFLFVEAEALPPDETLFRLELLDQEGQRHLLIDGVRFPELPARARGETP
ncbi:MAG TPA: DUF2381 family protein, partial [Myxococcaceae bacterium]|nr:DUF2381 family protein [Myxococcaceae bacterium]